MIEFGQTLRTARENKGYTCGQLAEITHLSPSTIGELESEDFSRIAAPIYGRGFVKLYCAAVGLDPQPLIEAFMTIYEGTSDLEIKERPATTNSVPEPTPAPSESPLAMEVPPAPPASPAPVSAPYATPTSPENSLSRYAAPLRQPTLSRLPPNWWRIGTLSIAAIALLVLIVLGIRALYQATDPRNEFNSTQPQPLESFTNTAPAEQSQSAAPVQNAQPRQAIPVPPLYVD